jgi:hypothetical protein
VEVGALMSYGTSLTEVSWQVGAYTVRRPRARARSRVNDGRSARPAKDLNAQGEQRDSAHTHDEDHQCHGVIVQPVSALYTHEGTSP